MSHGSQALGLDLSEASDRSRDQETGRAGRMLAFFSS